MCKYDQKNLVKSTNSYRKAVKFCFENMQKIEKIRKMVYHARKFTVARKNHES